MIIHLNTFYRGIFSKLVVNPPCSCNVQSLPNRSEALIVSSWPKTELPKDVNSIKKFENLQALV